MWEAAGASAAPAALSEAAAAGVAPVGVSDDPVVAVAAVVAVAPDVAPPIVDVAIEAAVGDDEAERVGGDTSCGGPRSLAIWGVLREEVSVGDVLAEVTDALLFPSVTLMLVVVGAAVVSSCRSGAEAACC